MSIIINGLEVDVNEYGDRHDVAIGNTVLYFRDGQLKKIHVTNPDGTTDTMFTKKTEKKGGTRYTGTLNVLGCGRSSWRSGWPFGVSKR